MNTEGVKGWDEEGTAEEHEQNRTKQRENIEGDSNGTERGTEQRGAK